jgi:hypothetical protein
MIKNQQATFPQKRLYDTRTWRRFREQILRERPLCELQLKLGYSVAATECDHRVALKDGGEPLDPANRRLLQGLSLGQVCAC